MHKFLLFLLLLVCLVGCRRNATNAAGTVDGVPIIYAGTYNLGTGGKIVISTPRQLVSYQVLDPIGKELLRSTQNASTHSRWFLYWEPEKARLWFYSGDIGTSVWLPQANGSYVQKDFGPNPEPLIKEMPAAFFDAMAGGAPDSWVQYRQGKVDQRTYPSSNRLEVPKP